jgi:hypothetical protein
MALQASCKTFMNPGLRFARMARFTFARADKYIGFSTLLKQIFHRGSGAQWVAPCAALGR